MHGQPDRMRRLVELRGSLVRGVLERVPDAVLNGDPGTGADERLPGNVHFSFPGCEGDLLLMLLDAAGVDCSTGSACTAGIPEPSHVLLAMGVDESLSRVLAALQPRRGVDAATTSMPCWPRSRVPSSGPVARARSRPGRADVRVIAAMSGGVDSSVAAARMVDAGHEVVGVHLALSRTSARRAPARAGCCTLDDARDARRVADHAGHPVLRLGPVRAVRART